MRDMNKFNAVSQKCQELLADKPEALAFLVEYGKYTELVDDCVDEEKDINRIAKLESSSVILWSSNYWLKNSQYLIIVEQLIHVIYFSAVVWESSDEAWKRRDARALSHISYGMLFAVLLLETRDVELVKSISLEFMERNHLIHFDDMTEEVKSA